MFFFFVLFFLLFFFFVRECGRVPQCFPLQSSLEKFEFVLWALGLVHSRVTFAMNSFMTQKQRHHTKLHSIDYAEFNDTIMNSSLFD